MEPLTWIRVGIEGDTPEEAFLLIENALDEAGFSFELEYEL